MDEKIVNIISRKVNAVDLKSKFLGGMVGSALGDAIGELAFVFPSREVLQSKVRESAELQYTDDTAMAIGLAESILKEGRIDHDKLGETFRRNFIREPWRGYASGPPTIFSHVEELGITYKEAAQNLFEGRGSYGNGAAMRVAPVGLIFHHAGDLYAQAAASAEVTHAHPVGIDGAAVQAYAVAKALKLDPRKNLPNVDFIQGLIGFSQTREIRNKMELVKTLLANDAGPAVAAEKIGQSVAVQESMPFAIYAFLHRPQSFEACLLCAILNGGDRDTLGAMAGAISGAYLGFDAIPQPWQEKLENFAYIESLALALSEL